MDEKKIVDAIRGAAERGAFVVPEGITRVFQVEGAAVGFVGETRGNCSCPECTAARREGRPDALDPMERGELPIPGCSCAGCSRLRAFDIERMVRGERPPPPWREVYDRVAFGPPFATLAEQIGITSESEAFALGWPELTRETDLRRLLRIEVIGPNGIAWISDVDERRGNITITSRARVGGAARVLNLAAGNLCRTWMPLAEHLRRRESQRVEIEVVLAEDARLHPEFAAARRVAVLAHVEAFERAGRPNIRGPYEARGVLASLHAYERGRPADLSSKTRAKILASLPGHTIVYEAHRNERSFVSPVSSREREKLRGNREYREGMRAPSPITRDDSTVWSPGS